MSLAEQMAALAVEIGDDMGDRVKRLSFGSTVMMAPAALGSGSWTASKPDNSEVSQTASTSDGLQEAITYAVGAAYPLRIISEGGKIGSTVYVDATATVAIPPAQIATIEANNLTLNMSGSPTNALSIDGLMMGHVDFRSSQIVTDGSGASLLLKPTNPVPVDLITAITDSFIRYTNVCAFGVGSTAVKVDLTSGSVVDNRLEHVELNGGQGGVGAAAYGYAVTNPQANTSFGGNVLTLGHMHLITGSCLALGTSATNAANISGNLILFGSMKPAGAASKGVDVWGSYNLILGAEITNQEGTLNRPIHLRPGSVGNLVIVPKASGYTAAAAVLDEGTNNCVFVNGQWSYLDYAVGVVADLRIQGTLNGLTFFYRGDNTKSFQWFASASGLLKLFSSVTGANVAQFDESGFLYTGVGLLKTVGARKTGWATATGTAARTTFDTATVTLEELAKRVKALIDDLHATAGHGLIGT